MRTYVARIEDPRDDPAALAAGIAELERRCGCAVSCDALAGRLRRQRRDSYLAAAHALMPGDTPRKKCHELAAAIARFEGTTWVRWRDYGTAPGGSRGISTVQSCLFKARQLARLPTTPEQLLNIVAKFKVACNLVEEPVQSPPDPE